jgi:hypothetical protein
MRQVREGLGDDNCKDNGARPKGGRYEFSSTDNSKRQRPTTLATATARQRLTG